MKKFLSRNWKALLFFTIIGAVGGYFTALYQYDTFPPEMLLQVTEQGLDRTMLGVITAVQVALIYGLGLGALGILLGEKVGLWKNEWSLTKKPLVATVGVAVLGGLAIILPDLLFFGRYSEVIMDSYASKPTVPFMIASITYGGVIEEVMMRLFFMSLIAFILYKIFERKQEKPSARILVIANIVAAVLFAAGHLPTTFATIGSSPMILARCFLLNGGVGLLFGFLYRKYGLRYAMLAHAGCHIVSKLIWILFI